MREIFDRNMELLQMRKFICLFTCVSVVLIKGISADQGDVYTEEMAQAWYEEYNIRAQQVSSRSIESNWNYQTNLTEYNKNVMLNFSLLDAEFDKEAFTNASKYNWTEFTNGTLKRLFRKITDVGTAVLPDSEIRKVNDLGSTMQGIYGNAEVCGRPSDGDKSKCYNLEPGLVTIMSTSRDWDELKWAWKGWRDASGRKMKDMYEQFVELNNKAAQMNNYADNGEYWRSWYEIGNFTEECERLFNQVKPLYQQLHAYVRRKLKEKYERPEQEFPKEGHIPAHILGNMWAQSFSDILDLVIPYKNKSSIDITPELEKQGYNATGIFLVAEDFFKSLGMYEMPQEFWNKSMIERPSDGRSVVCHASAWDFYNQKDFRIKQCTDITMNDMVTTHHEMGHVQYYLQYKHQPINFRRGANPGFHEAVGDVMSLSVATPEHLKKMGLLKIVENDTAADINYLMSQALRKIAFLPFGFLIDQWRWKVFSGDIKKDNYNTAWWDLRCKYQGLSPTVPRSEEDFDPGAKFHIPNNTPYIRYFISFILQFQFHKALCETAGQLQNGAPLHRCDIYNSKAAGTKLSEMLQLGSSEPWPVAMEKLTGKPMWSAEALMEYFKPLTEWLEKENEGHETGWDEACPTVATPTTPTPPVSAAPISLPFIFLETGLIVMMMLSFR